MNLYKTLGVERDATLAEIKSVFRARAKDLHPDKGGNDEAFKKLSFAYMVLKNEKRRAMYDETGKVDKDEIDSDLRKISSVLLKLFEVAIEEGIASRNDLDVIKLMKEFLKKEVKAKEEKIKGIGAELVKIQQLAKRISCREGNRNLFGSIIDNKRKLLEHSRVGLGQDLRIIKLVLEELEAYDCLVEVVRMVDLYFVGGITASTA